MVNEVRGFSMIPVTKDLYAVLKAEEGGEAKAYPVIAIAIIAYDTDSNGEWHFDYTERNYLLAMPADEDAAWVDAEYIKGFFLKGQEGVVEVPKWLIK